MKKSLLLLFLGLTLVLSSCKKSDDNSTAPTTPTDPIVGTWVAQGANIPVGLRVAPFKAIKIVATFNENKTYSVLQTDSSNTTTPFSGTYTIEATNYKDTLSTTGTKGATIYNIVATQSAPYAATSTGIFAISGSNMAYEIIQTTPPLSGVNAPTAQAGFGSTTIAGVKWPIYIQKYVKQ